MHAGYIEDGVYSVIRSLSTSNIIIKKRYTTSLNDKALNGQRYYIDYNYFTDCPDAEPAAVRACSLWQ